MNFKLHRRETRHATSLLVLLIFSATVFAQPKLVVGIMVDGLQQTHLDQLHDRLGVDGLRKLTEAGVSFAKMQSNVVSAGNASDITTIMAGTVPYYHGIISNQAYNRNNQKIESIFKDDAFAGIDSHLKLSAKNMRTTSVLDEMVMHYQGQSKVYAVGIHAEDAIALGGHTANGVVWMDDVLMKWGSTSYYKDGMPWQALDMNQNGSFQRYVDRVWQPKFPASTYLAALDTRKPKAFEYKPSSKKNANRQNSILKISPSANSLVAELALRLLQEQDLGQGKQPDALMLQFTVRTPNEQDFSVQTMEKEDIYLRLDDELQFLIQKIEYKLGRGNVLFVLFGNQNNSYSPEELKAHNIHAGYFNSNRAIALLSSYLMAIYGHEKWINGYYGRQIYFNKRLIEEKDIDFAKMQTTAIDFIMEFEGVQSAHSYNQLMNSGFDPNSELSKTKNSTHKNYAGDIILSLMPGWLEVDNDDNPIGASSNIHSTVPIWFYGANLDKKIITQAHWITDIAPTISAILGIPVPNGNVGQFIKLESF